MLKSNHTARKSSGRESEMASSTTPPSGLMCERSMDASSLAKWASSLEDSPANLIRLLAGVKAKTMTVTSGPTRRELLARYDPATCSWRMCQDSLPGVDTPRVMSGRSYQTLPAWGMTANGELWALEMSGRPTKETGGGAWPTPQASDVIEGFSNSKAHTKQWNGLNTLPLMAISPCPANFLRGLQAPGSGIGGQTSSPDGPNSLQQSKRHLNPRFVEWLMGVPIGWVRLKPLEMESYQQWWQMHFRGWNKEGPE